LNLNGQGQVQFNPEAAGNRSLAEYLQSPDAKDIPGLTGGIQGSKGTLFGIPYAAGSWQDNLIEAFSGTHDMIGGKISGLYDEQGNAIRGRTTLEVALHNRWSEIAIPISTPFAAAEVLSPEMWQAISILLKAAK
jgi:filamentous hemagglutinin